MQRVGRAALHGCGTRNTLLQHRLQLQCCPSLVNGLVRSAVFTTVVSTTAVTAAGATGATSTSGTLRASATSR